MRYVICTLVVCLVFVTDAFSLPKEHNPNRHPEFVCPSGLRARVDFWKDVFTKYGQNQVVIHHRDFPHAIFEVIDFQQEAETLGPIAFDVLKKRTVESRIQNIREALKGLAGGYAPESLGQRKVAHVMYSVPGGMAKYKDALDRDLVRSQTGIREKYADALSRSGRYLPIMERIFVEDYKLPVELTRLPFVESSFDYNAYSSDGAAGIWQFMPRTARNYMTVNTLVDERRDPVESTQAAARYMETAYSRLGTWPLAVTSYNHGIAGVMRKARESGTSSIVAMVETPGSERPFGFASGNFYAELLAAIEVYDDRALYFPDVRMEPPLRIAKMRLPRPVYVSYLSKSLGVGSERLKAVNYALSEKVWSGRAMIPSGYAMKVPVELAPKLMALDTGTSQAQEIKVAASSVYGNLTYRVRRGDTLLKIAKKFGLSVSELRSINRLGAKATLREGSVLVVGVRAKELPREKKAHAKAQTQANANQGNKAKSRDVLNGKKETVGGVQNTKREKTDEPALVTADIKYKIRPGDTLHSLSRQYGVSVDDIRQANGIHSASVFVNQEITMPLSKKDVAQDSRKKTSAAPKEERSPKTVETKSKKDKVDQAPRVSSAKTYKVRKGDNPWTIARRLKISVADLERLNGIQAKRLKIGQELILP